MADINTYVAKNYELWGAGFGVLTYKGQVLDLISDFNDSGQPALGEPLDVMTINDQRPRTIIPPMAISSGTFTFTTFYVALFTNTPNIITSGTTAGQLSGTGNEVTATGTGYVRVAINRDSTS
jgi:hypothetical protein